MCKKNNFQIFLFVAIEMAVLSVFLQTKGLGPSRVKVEALISNNLSISTYRIKEIC